jgi:hypothetical protein
LRTISNIEGWRLDYLLNNGNTPSGVVLKNVYHNLHPMARDIRVVGLWIGFRRSKQSAVGLRLGSPQIPVKHGPSETSFFTRGYASPYREVGSIGALFSTPGGVIAHDSGELFIEQDYIFTEYSNTPSHEPSGNISAARLYPRIGFRISPSGSKESAPDFVRIDYRMQLELSSLDSPQRLRRNRSDPFYSQAGVFGDNDNFDLTSAVRTANEPDNELFDIAEKPLIYEVIVTGIKSGSKGEVDNIHYWPASVNTPSAPGAFHAVHCHWRWLPSAADPTFFQKMPGAPFSGGGIQYGFNPGQPLIDTSNREQNLTLAVTNNTRWPSEIEYNNLPYDYLTILKKQTPVTIRSGAPLILWFSYEFYRNFKVYPYNEPWSGRAFVNGIFFTHDPQPSILTSPSTLPSSFTQRPFYKPYEPNSLPREWERYSPIVMQTSVAGPGE